MSMLFSVISAHRCRSNHHRIALEALRHLRTRDAGKWTNLFLKHNETYFDGAKAPDTTFKDFQNHVLHVRDDYWGGAPKAALHWYGQTVDFLRARDWPRAVYAAGVLTHYVTDPHQPFHTGQAEEEGAIHRAVEWSFSKAYDELYAILVDELGGYPDIQLPDGDDWLTQLIRTGAHAANEHYETVIDHYDLEKGRKDPPAGLDQEIKDCIAGMLGMATIAVARILDRAFEEAAVAAPTVNITLDGYMASLDIPLRWVTKKMGDANERALIQKMYGEYKKTGKVVKTLPDDDKVVRRLHAEQILGVSMAELDARPARAPGSGHGGGTPARRRGERAPARRAAPSRRPEPSPAPTPAPAAAIEPRSERTRRSSEPRFYLNHTDPVEDAPSIGPKTAARLEAIGVTTVADLLALDPGDAAGGLNARHITAKTLTNWRDQSALQCRVPGLRGHDAQILVGCDVRDAEGLSAMDVDDLLLLAEAFSATPEGKRILRSSQPPNRPEVADWINWAQEARPLMAA